MTKGEIIIYICSKPNVRSTLSKLHRLVTITDPGCLPQSYLISHSFQSLKRCSIKMVVRKEGQTDSLEKLTL